MSNFGCNPLEVQYDDNIVNIKPPQAPGINIDPTLSGDTITVLGSSIFTLVSAGSLVTVDVEVFIDSQRYTGAYYYQQTGQLGIQKISTFNGYYTARFDVYTTTESGSLADLQRAEFFKYSFSKTLLFIDPKPDPVANMKFNVENGMLKLYWTPREFDHFRKSKYQIYRDYAGISNELVYSSESPTTVKKITDTTCVDTKFIGGTAKYRVKTIAGNLSVFSEDFTFNDPVQLDFQIVRLQNDKLQFVFTKNPYSSTSPTFIIQRKSGADFLSPFESENFGIYISLESLISEPDGKYKTAPLSNLVEIGGDSYYRVAYLDSDQKIRNSSVSKSMAIGTKIDQFEGIKNLSYLPELNQYVISGKNSVVIDADNYNFIKHINGHVLISENRQFATVAETAPYVNGGYQINAVYTPLSYPNLSPSGQSIDFGSILGKSVYSFDIKLLNTNEIGTSFWNQEEDLPMAVVCNFDSSKITVFNEGSYLDAKFSGDKKFAIASDFLYKIVGNTFILLGSSSGQFIENTEYIIDYNFSNGRIEKKNRNDLSVVISYSNLNVINTRVIYDTITNNFLVETSDRVYTLIDGNTGSKLKVLKTAVSPVKLHNNNLFFETGYVFKIQ